MRSRTAVVRHAEASQTLRPYLQREINILADARNNPRPKKSPTFERRAAPAAREIESSRTGERVEMPLLALRPEEARDEPEADKQVN